MGGTLLKEGRKLERVEGWMGRGDALRCVHGGVAVVVFQCLIWRWQHSPDVVSYLAVARIHQRSLYQRKCMFYIMKRRYPPNAQGLHPRVVLHLPLAPF